MGDVNPALANRLIFHAICQQQGKDFEREWVEYQFNRLSKRQKAKYSIQKIRRYLLDNLCQTNYVELKIQQIIQERLSN